MTLEVVLQPMNFDTRAVAARVGLPVHWLLGGDRLAFSVDAPPGWSERNLTSHLIQTLGPAIYRIDAAQQAAPLGGCNCIGRR